MMHTVKHTALMLLLLSMTQQTTAQQSAASSATQQRDRLQLESSLVKGNQELPKVMYIVPWKDAGIGDIAGRPVNSLLEEVLAPVDREEFRRQVRYFSELDATVVTAGE